MDAKINALRVALVILLLIMFGSIFRFSNQDGEKSGSLSREITENVTKNVKTIQRMEKSKKEKTLDKIEHFIRKLAHFSLYTVVGILMMSLMSTYNLIQMKRLGISLGVGVIYAISDEFHQMFIPDRSSSIIDIFIDSCGVFVGILVVVLGLKVIKRVVSRKCI